MVTSRVLSILSRMVLLLLVQRIYNIVDSFPLRHSFVSKNHRSNQNHERTKKGWKKSFLFLYSKDTSPPAGAATTAKSSSPKSSKGQAKNGRSKKSQHYAHNINYHAHHNPNLPIPAMPSDNFRKMAQSQLELLANSLTRVVEQPNGTSSTTTQSKVQSMILYLPQENSFSGQLEFTPAVLYPDPSTERVFIASDAASGQAPTLPKELSKLPGFSSAPDLLPGYPMLPTQNQNEPGVGSVEEVVCDVRFETCALSVPLLSGSQTVGVLLVSPTVNSNSNDRNKVDAWTNRDKQQVSLAAQSLSMALNMDNERTVLSEQNTVFRENLSDSLHQMKNPIQALRTYGKILQRQIVENSSNEDAMDNSVGGGTAQLLELAERLMVQSDRVVDMLGPMDSLVETLNSPVMLPPAAKDATTAAQSMVLLSSSSSSDPLPYLNTSIEEDFGNDYDFPPTNQYTNSSSVVISDESTAEGAVVGSSSSSSSSNLPAVIGDFETEMVFLTDVLEPVFETFRDIASEQGIAFEVIVDEIDDLPGVFVAPKSFREAVSNVLDNALKYAILPKAGSPFPRNPSPKVRVLLFPTNEEDSSMPGVSVLVQDNGPGVAPDEKYAVFERGYRGSLTASKVPGNGIGLDISRALLARMGGSLNLASAEDVEKWGFDDPALDGAAMKFEVTRKPQQR